MFLRAGCGSASCGRTRRLTTAAAHVVLVVMRPLASTAAHLSSSPPTQSCVPREPHNLGTARPLLVGASTYQGKQPTVPTAADHTLTCELQLAALVHRSGDRALLPAHTQQVAVRRLNSWCVMLVRSRVAVPAHGLVQHQRRCVLSRRCVLLPWSGTTASRPGKGLVPHSPCAQSGLLGARLLALLAWGRRGGGEARNGQNLRLAGQGQVQTRHVAATGKHPACRLNGGEGVGGAGWHSPTMVLECRLWVGRELEKRGAAARGKGKHRRSVGGARCRAFGRPLHCLGSCQSAGRLSRARARLLERCWHAGRAFAFAFAGAGLWTVLTAAAGLPEQPLPAGVAQSTVLTLRSCIEWQYRELGRCLAACPMTCCCACCLRTVGAGLFQSQLSPPSWHSAS